MSPDVITNGTKLTKKKEGFTAVVKAPWKIYQVQIPKVHIHIYPKNKNIRVVHVVELRLLLIINASTVNILLYVEHGDGTCR